ncbi:MAG: type I DNA topoisomerase [Desulfovibrionaceae bacterium]|nr:type I DNA topoisomerase [Desulfovibrionaceae bacterium]
MGKDLIIVESPAKVKTIKKFLGNKYAVQASVGHIRDLPAKEIGVDEAHDFAPRYETIKGKEKIVSALREAAAKADTVYLAPDPDREGEAIAWHIGEVIRNQAKNIKRIQFNEITARAVKEALAHPRAIDPRLFEAQQARRVLDRLVGYKISPLLWKTVKRGISAGRVQSVALRLIVEREEERLAFVPEEYWQFKALLAASQPPSFKADLIKVDGKKAVVPNADAAQGLEDVMRGKPFVVESVDEKERSRNPAAPFTTSTLQQTANQRMGFSAKRTMSTAQRLYEGIELGERGTTALITYMRTDSVRIADEARAAAAEFISERFGREYLAPGGKGRVFKGKSGAQDAHEAIRPVDVRLTPQDVKDHLTPEQYRLYSLIWSRFVASQMAPAAFHDTTALISCGPAQWRARGERLLFPGFLAAMPRPADEEEDALPPLRAGEELKLEKLSKEQKFTQPAPRYTEASLVRELEDRGIGRPSTYAAIISTIQDREYVRLEDKHFTPTDLGKVVCSQLREHFPVLMDVGFTAGMEDNLDKVADGALGWVGLLRDFTRDFDPALSAAAKNMVRLKDGLGTDLPCPQCGKPLVVKFGKSGEFLACTGYPECRYTTNFIRDEKGAIQPQARQQEQREVVGACPQCGGDVVIKKSHTGSRFLSCVNYPKCTYAAPFSTGVPCPRCGKGTLVEKSSKRGKIFYSCDQYPACDYALWDWPIHETCPECDSPLLVVKNTRARGRHIACPNPKCRYTRELSEPANEPKQ